MIINDELNRDDPKYQEMYKYAKYGSPLELIGNCTIQMLCLYDGNDGLVHIILIYVKLILIMGLKII